MALKSYRLKLKKKPRKKVKKSNAQRLLSQGTTAILGVALLSTTADAVARI